MALVDAARFNALKQEVRAECLRRCYIGSVADYGGTDYDYVNPPVAGHLVEVEHFEKLAVPLNQINNIVVEETARVVDTEGNRIISDEELTAMEAVVTKYKTRSMSDTTQGDCRTSCTGACHTGCSTTCSGGCGANCSGTCTGTCRGCSGCSGSCSGSCTGCGYGCSSGCYGTCTGSCKSTCTMQCGNQGCVGTCLTLCYNGCTTSCQQACGYCGTNCTGVSK